MQNNNKNTYKTPKTVTLHPFLLIFSYLCTLEEYKSGFCETQVRFSKAAFLPCCQLLQRRQQTSRIRSREKGIGAP